MLELYVQKKCGASSVYLLEALGSPYQINNTPHPYGDVPDRHDTPNKVMNALLFP